MRAGQATLETTDMHKPLIEIELIPAEGDELRYPQPVAIGQENHRVIAEPMPANAPGRLAQAGDFGGGQVLPRTHVRVCVALGKGEFRHLRLLTEELSCLRWLVPENREGALSATTLPSLAYFPENSSFQE